jgi:HK97 family phage major capsid protein
MSLVNERQELQKVGGEAITAGLPRNIHDVAKLRHETREKAEAMLDGATKAGRDLTKEEQTTYAQLKDVLKACTVKLDEHSYGQGQQRPVIYPAGWTEPKSGKEQGPVAKLFAKATGEMRNQMRELAKFIAGALPIHALSDLRPAQDGAVIIPEFISETIERNYSQFSPVAGVARLFPTENGADTIFPVLSDSESAEQLDAAASTGADATVSGDTPPTDLTGPTMKAYKVSSKPVFVPRETFTDSAINILEEIVGALTARVIRFENNRFTNGSGSGQAQGFLTACSVFDATGALDLDIALDLAYSVPQLYRGNGVYMMSDTTAKYLRKLKTGISGDKRQLWADADATKGTPATLHGYPVIINNDMTSVQANGTFTGGEVAFGDFSRFVIRQAEQNRLYAYRYPVPARDGGAVILFRRTDSRLLVSEAVAKLGVSGS